jgi:PAS domain S-box-containing protein
VTESSGFPDPDLQQRLMISFVDEAHVSMWACDDQFRVVLWNEGAARMYGRSADSVLGKRYDELFIDPAEREQSLKDCQKIIRDGTRFENFLATDHDARGHERQMLTNCFRITDPITGVHYQAEIGVDIADLPLAQKNLRTLRELGIRQLAEREQSLMIRKTSLEDLLSQIRHEVGLAAKSKTDQVDDALQSARRLNDENRRRFEARKHAVITERKRIEADLDEFRSRVRACTDIDATVAVSEDLPTVEDWLARIDRAERAAK